jgi:serine/threonine-protein kinase
VVAIKQGTVIAGRYRLERPIGRGGMGAVWVARHLQLDSEVAVKVMDPSRLDSTEARTRFDREAKAVAQLRSPYIVQVHDYGVQDDMPYLVMELLEGEGLDARLKRQGRLTPATTTPIVTSVCKALRRIHEVGLVHRDLKPGNVFVSRHDDEEIVKVIDFGIAKSTSPLLGEQATITGALLGSPHYMSPEQVRSGKHVDHRSDLWSVGVIAYRCLTGQYPFGGDMMGDVLVAICTDPFTPASQIVPELGPEADRFFERALTRDPAGRFQSARDLALAFAAFAGDAGASAEWASLPRPEGMPLEPAFHAAAKGSLTPPPAGGTYHPDRQPRTRTVLIAAALAIVVGGVAAALARSVASPDRAPAASVDPPPRPIETAPAAVKTAAVEATAVPPPDPPVASASAHPAPQKGARPAGRPAATATATAAASAPPAAPTVPVVPLHGRD